MANRKVRVAIVGVGNCASSLVQGVQFYKDAAVDDFIPGLMHVSLGGLHVRDIEFSAAFDVNRTKVGKDLGEAVFAEPNNTAKFADVPELGVKVQRGMTHDGLGEYLSKVIQKADGPTVDVTEVLRKSRTDVVVNFLPVGSEEATKWYVEQALQAVGGVHVAELADQAGRLVGEFAGPEAAARRKEELVVVEQKVTRHLRR